jgi:hypothetical protein
MIARRLVEQEDDLPLPFIVEMPLPAGRRNTNDDEVKEELVILLLVPGLALT